MALLYYVAYFFGGVFLVNAIPHLVSGLMGHPFQSPFAKPPGKGLSTSTVNVLWGAFNIAVSYLLLGQVGDFDLHSLVDVLIAGLGALLMGLMLARAFGRYNGGNFPKKR
jgi:hypothetical protein